MSYIYRNVKTIKKVKILKKYFLILFLIVQNIWKKDLKDKSRYRFKNMAVSC